MIDLTGVGARAAQGLCKYCICVVCGVPMSLDSGEGSSLRALSSVGCIRSVPDPCSRRNEEEQSLAGSVSESVNDTYLA